MKKVALLFISLNPPYWPYLREVMIDCKARFLPGHQVDMFTWTDMGLYDFSSDVTYGAKEVFPTEPIQWPMPTLLRYNLFLQQEDKLKDYDYIFYMDADMRVVDVVGDEILGQGLTMAEHPMYSIRREYIPPYEPNPDSTAYIPRFGAVITNEHGRPWFKPLYAAGGFQGGTGPEFIKAMKVMKANIEKDFVNNYTAIWNDESHWNKYLSEYKGHMVVLSPSYVFPDSLINEYYVKVWGKQYVPKIVTLTKPFTTTKAAGTELINRLGTM